MPTRYQQHQSCNKGLGHAVQWGCIWWACHSPWPCWQACQQICNLPWCLQWTCSALLSLTADVTNNTDWRYHWDSLTHADTHTDTDTHTCLGLFSFDVITVQLCIEELLTQLWDLTSSLYIGAALIECSAAMVVARNLSGLGATEGFSRCSARLTISWPRLPISRSKPSPDSKLAWQAVIIITIIW